THHYVMDVVGAVLAFAGAAILHVVLRAWPVTSSTWISLGLLVLIAATHLYRRLRPKGGSQPPAPPLSKLRHEDWRDAPIQPIEQLLGSNELAAQRAQWQRSSRYLRLALPLFAIALIGLGVNFGTKLWSLQTHGVSADGSIVSLELSRNGNNSSY